MAGKKKSEGKRTPGRPRLGPKKFVSASIDEALYDRFVAYRAENEDVTPSGVIARALREFLDRRDAEKADA